MPAGLGAVQTGAIVLIEFSRDLEMLPGAIAGFVAFLAMLYLASAKVK